MSRNDIANLQRIRNNAEKAQIEDMARSIFQILQNIEGTGARKAHLLQYCKDKSSNYAEYLFLKKQLFTIITFDDDNEIKEGVN